MKSFFATSSWLLFWVVFSISFAEASDLKIAKKAENFLKTQWTTENGLPQNSVTSIAQTPDGYLWLSTFGGLARFDGVRFKIHTTSNTPELKSNRFTSLKTDQNGTLWIGTERGEIICYKNHKFRFIDDGEKIGNSVINDIFVDENNLVWIGSNGGLEVCNEAACQKENFSESVSRIRKDSVGNLLILSDNQLIKVEEKSFNLIKIIAKDVANFELNPTGEIWISLFDEFGIYKNDVYETKLKFDSKSEYVGILKAPDGSCWLNFTNVLYHVKDENIEQFEIKNVGANSTGQVFFDRESNLWVGRTGDGLVRLLRRRIQHLSEENGFPKNLAANSLAEDNQGNIWINTDIGLLRWIEGKIDKQFLDKPEDYGNRDTLMFDSKETLWNVGGKGLMRFENGKFISRNDLSWDKKGSGNALFEDSKKNLWFGCETCGVFVFDGNQIIANYTIENGLVGNAPHSITETRDGAIWIGTRTGISRLKDGKFTNYKNKDGLSNEYVRDIYEDQDGALWIGTYGGGLNRFKDGKFTPITTNHGLFDDIVSRILVDEDDNFWMLGNRGIYSVNRKMLNDFADGKTKQIYCSAYTTADGMITDEGNGGYQNSAIRTRDGKLWFSMIRGIVIIDPKQEKLPPPKPMIEEVFLNGKLIDKLKKIEINPGNESLEINYTGINFRQPEQIRFRYRLAGLDENWTEAGTRRLANYPYLPSGEYRFQLSATNADGVWSEQIDELEIVVFPPFYRTWWFYLLAFASFIAIAYLIFRIRLKQIENDRMRQLEFSKLLINAQESERQRIAAELHDSIGQDLLIIKNRALLGSSQKSDEKAGKEQLSEISETATHALDEARMIARNLRPLHLQRFGLTQTLRGMLEQVQDSSQIEFQTEIDDIDGLFSEADELSIFRIVQECLNNIVKHSGAKSAKIEVTKSPQSVKLLIQDFGQGFDTGSNLSRKDGNSGFGLASIGQRVTILDGNLKIDSTIGIGTTITIFLRLKNA